MKIAICGTQNIGKTTFVEDFIKEWPMYTQPSRTYRDIANDDSLELETKTNEEAQLIILDELLMEQAKGSAEHIIYDRCCLDNLAYTMWLSAKGYISDSFVKKTIDIVKESLTYYDIIFFAPITKYSPIPIDTKYNADNTPVDDEFPEQEKKFREEVDVVFKSLMNAYQQTSRAYFPYDHELGCPPLIESFGSREERIQMAKFYVNEKGNIFDEEDSMIDPDEIDLDGQQLAGELAYQGGIAPKGTIITP